METRKENFHFHLGTERAAVIAVQDLALLLLKLFGFSSQAGASGALFGLIGLLVIKLLRLRHEVKRPCLEVLILLGVVLVSFGKLGNYNA